MKAPLTLALLLAAGSSGTVGAGSAAYEIPDASGLHVSHTLHTAFALPAGWRQQYGTLSGRKAFGNYQRLARVGGNSCIMSLQVSGRAGQTPPSVTGGHLRLGSSSITGIDFRIEQAGSSGALRWYLGRENGWRVAVAYQPTPPKDAPAPKRWTIFQMILSDQPAPAHGGRPTIQLRHACTARRDALNFLPAAIRSIHLTAGPP